MSLRLYVDAKFVSPYAMAAFIALREKGAKFDLETVDLAAGVQRAAAYATLAPTQKVPTLVHDGFALSESSAICEYIHEVMPGTPLYPSDPKARARARQVQAWIRSDLMPIREERTTEVVFYGPTDKPLSTAAKAAADRLFRFADALLPAGAENLCGSWCIADPDLALMLNRLVMNGDAVPARLAEYAKRQWQRPSVQEWVRQPRPPR